MPTITKISPQVKTPGRFNIFIDDEFAFGVSEQVLLNEKLKIGLELDSEKLEYLKTVIEKDKTFEKILNYLSYRPRSVDEIKRYLREKNVTDDYIEEIINRLEKMHYLDDAEFARWYVEQRREKSKGWGNRRIQMALRRLGVDNDHISKALQDSLEEVSETEIAQREAQKLFKKNREKDPFKAKKKMSDALARRGFSWDVIKEIVAEFDFG